MTYDVDTLKEMIPSYLNGRLGAEEQQAFEKGLAAYPELAAELAEYEAIQGSYRQLEAETPFPDQDPLFDRIMAQIDREAAAPAQPPQAAPEAPTAGLAETLHRFFHDLFGSPRVAWAVAAVQVVLLVALLVGLPQRHAFQTLTTPGPSAGARPALNVVFDENAIEKEIRALLVETGVTIVGGPSVEGLYILAVPGERPVADVSRVLSRSKLVIFVEQRY